MSLAVWFWVLMLLLLVGGGYAYRSKWSEAVPGIVLFLVLVVIGLAQFGGPIRG